MSETFQLENFQEQLLSLMDQKNHWAWKHFSGPNVTSAQLKLHYQQEYAVYVRDFPLFLGRLYAQNPPLSIRQGLAINLYEEETGGLSLGQSHRELFLKMMQGLNFREVEFRRITLLPKSKQWRQWLDNVTQSSHWLEGIAVITIFVEGSVRERQEIGNGWPDPSPIEEVIQNHFLVRHHHADPSCLDLIRAHYQVEHGHRLSAWRMVLQHVQSRATQQSVYDAMKRSLELWLEYRDAVADAAGIKP